MVAYHMMQMKLRDQIAQSTDVQFFAVEGLHQQGPDVAGLIQQGPAIVVAQLVDLAHALPPRHQDHPGVTAIVQQQHPRQRQIAEQMAVSRELRIQGKATRGDVVYGGTSGRRRPGACCGVLPARSSRRRFRLDWTRRQR